MGGFLIQGRHGAKGNFEVVVPPTHGEGLIHFWRNNDSGALPWSGPTCFGRGLVTHAGLIQSKFGTPGNLEVVAVVGDQLMFYWRRNSRPWTWSGPHPLASGVRGAPALIQSRHGARGNFEVVVPHRDGGLIHLWRNNDNPSMTWSTPQRFGNARRLYEGAALIQADQGMIGNLEVVAVEGEELVLYWRHDTPPWTWNGPFPITGGVRGAPALIQSRHGGKGNFEVVVPHRESGLVHLWRNNDNGSLAWSPPTRFGDGRRYRDVALIQGNFGAPGNLEAVARDDTDALAFYWRRDHAPSTWNGPLPIGAERSWTASECVYSWTAAFLQADTHVVVRVQLVPDAGIPAATLAHLQATWRDSIISKWSDRFDCAAPNGERRRITVDVQWVTSNPHHIVRVQAGPARSDMTTWDTMDSGDVASHEFGHMLGLADEHSDAACPGRSPVNTGTVMDDNTEVVARLLNGVAGFHCSHTPTARLAFADVFGELTEVHFFERLDDLEQKKFRQALERAAARKLSDAESREVRVVLSISGGAPGERYEYRLEVRADGSVETQFVDGLRQIRPGRPTRAVVGRDAAAAVFQQIARNEFVALPDILARTTPDGLVTVISVQVNDAAKLVRVPVFERGSDAAVRLDARALPLPVRDDLVVSRDAAPPALAAVLEALREVQARLR
jgi:hypothetical protein